MHRQHHLVVGGETMVGAALVRRLHRSGLHVRGTTRRHDAATDTNLFLDLSAVPDDWNPPKPVDVAILCAGVTRLKACKEQPRESRRINVEGIAKVAEILRKQGAFIIYLSTNQVFDGTRPLVAASSSTSPVTEYGRQKAETEQSLSKAGTVDAIVRLTKVMGPVNALIEEWKRDLLAGRTITPFSDMTLAPIPLSCVVSVLTMIAQERRNGTFQVSGERDITYADAARMGAEALGVSPELVRPVLSAQSDPDSEPSPIHTSLNIDLLRATFGIAPPEVRWTIETAFLTPQLLAGA
jgi:dTDP-4-dehydrorhamnose reductase